MIQTIHISAAIIAKKRCNILGARQALIIPQGNPRKHEKNNNPTPPPLVHIFAKPI
jgi:hypothetical protein